MADYRVMKTRAAGSVAIIEMNNPPVNALGDAVRSELLRCLKQAIADKEVKAIVLCGKNGIFSAGADIREFGNKNRQVRDANIWITNSGREIDRSPKPVIAAISGVALGGGLEVALFCHYRVALNTARLGFPEVQIGVLPGAEGTLRLPRVTGLKNALDIITTGNHVTADNALKMGLVDKVVTGDIVNEGIKFALSVAKKDPAIVSLRNRSVSYEGNLDEIEQAALAKVKTKYRGFVAPIFCVKSVINSARLPYEKAMELEQAYFQELLASSQAAAQRYAFFAERSIAKWKLPTGGNYKTATPLPVRSVGVIGAGTMGGGIALSLITSGLSCTLMEQSQEFLDKGLGIMKGMLAGSVRIGKMSADQAKQCWARLTPTVNIEDLKDVDLVIEAVFEDLKLKREIFGKLDKICKPEAILCTNTSTLDIDLIAVATNRPDKVVGTHFFAPSYIMKLLENIYGTKTSAESVATVMKLGKTIKKVSVLVGSCTGFAANRIRTPWASEAQFVVEEGALPHEVDQVLQDFGLPMGTFEVSDLSGLDVQYRIRREAARKLGVTLTPDTKLFQGQRHCGLPERLVEMGRLGKKTGKGWYKYEKPGSRTPYVDPDVTRVIEEHCRSLGIQRRTVGSQEILERLLFSMINEAFKVLEDGICRMPEEIDILWIYGFSWPKYAGGPMYYASKVGLKNVYERISYYHKEHPFSMHWVPSRLLKKLAERDIPFSQWGDAVGDAKL